GGRLEHRACASGHHLRNGSCRKVRLQPRLEGAFQRCRSARPSYDRRRRPWDGREARARRHSGDGPRREPGQVVRVQPAWPNLLVRESVRCCGIKRRAEERADTPVETSIFPQEGAPHPYDLLSSGYTALDRPPRAAAIAVAI